MDHGKGDRVVVSDRTNLMEISFSLIRELVLATSWVH